MSRGAEDAYAEILGIQFDQLTSSRFLSLIEARLLAKVPTRLALANPEFCVVAQRQLALKKYLNDCDIVVADGIGVVIAAKFLGFNIPERITGTDFVYQLASICERIGATIFFYGGEPDVANEAAKQLIEQHAALKVVGAEHGYQDNRPGSPLWRKIQECKPDVLMVCLGNPRQENWISEFGQSLPASLIFGNGGALDFTAGRVKRAPAWMLKCGLEWGWRVCQDFTFSRVRRVLRLPIFVSLIIWQRFFPRSFRREL